MNIDIIEKGKVVAYPFEGKIFNNGSVYSLVEATNYFYNKGK